ncbi:hypothetical protein AX774_g1561 [Zancudomyces culisetae]|uniref:Uncharacterized protein n=1 Tax=Zancudomyces culisetae TaxID=1213189 RepID=A0A1R1PVA5_ZANCU|nr:hypothetical protein AX774_g1561 [Zancudomyces culisetae]|eukprot:OMH84906.1 hypothetical protein AX774_g1561 [Zancudomyces culisetae]
MIHIATFSRQAIRTSSRFIPHRRSINDGTKNVSIYVIATHTFRPNVWSSSVILSRSTTFSAFSSPSIPCSPTLSCCPF